MIVDDCRHRSVGRVQRRVFVAIWIEIGRECSQHRQGEEQERTTSTVSLPL